MRRPDVPALVAGLAVAGFGVALLLNATGEVDMGFGAMAPIVCAAFGATLMALGLGRRN